MNVTFYSGFTKRVNSTKRPSGGTTLSVALKDDTSIESPVFRLDKGNNAAYMNYNYCQFNGAYYYIDDVVLTNRNIYEYHCRKDVLATERAHIMASEQYISRSTSDYDPNIIDAAYPSNGVTVNTNIKPNQASVGGSYTGLVNLAQSAVILGVIGGNAGASITKFGATSYYLLTIGAAANFLNYLTSDTAYFQIQGTDLSEGMQKALINPFQYVVSCFVIPGQYDSISQQLTNIHSVYNVDYIEFGYGFRFNQPAGLLVPPFDITGTQPSNIVRVWEWNIDIPNHPQMEESGSTTGRAYLNRSPYSEHYIFAHPFGQVAINDSFIQTNRSVKIYAECDVITGKGQMIIANSSGNTIYSFAQGQIGISIPIAQISVDKLAVEQAEMRQQSALIGGVVNTAANLATGNIVGAINSAITAFTGQAVAGNDALRAKQPIVQKGGIQDSLMALIRPVLLNEYNYVAPLAREKFGSPLNQPRTLSNLSGFVQVDSPVYGSAIRADDNLSVMQFLKGGIYLE